MGNDRKKIIYQNRGTRNGYSIRNFERVLELERESEEIYAQSQDKIELYARKWEKYIRD